MSQQILSQLGQCFRELEAMRAEMAEWRKAMAALDDVRAFDFWRGTSFYKPDTSLAALVTPATVEMTGPVVGEYTFQNVEHKRRGGWPKGKPRKPKESEA